MASQHYSRQQRYASRVASICAAAATVMPLSCSQSSTDSGAAAGQAAGGEPAAGQAAVTAAGASASSGGPGGGGAGGAAASSSAGAGVGGAIDNGGAPSAIAGDDAGGRASGGSSAGAGASAGASTNGGSAAIDLFNGTDLTGFKVYRENTEKAPGTLLTTAQALPIFKPENGTIHVYADAPDQSTQVHYTLVTAQSYSKYILSWEYKWGTKKFAPYTDLTKYPRDAGVLWHIHGDITQLWPASIEFQNKFGSTGDVFALYARCSSPGALGNTTVFAEGGTPVLVNGSNGFVQHGRSENFEVADGWTPLVLQVNGDSAVYTMNGHVVNRVSAVTTGSGTPVTSGPIAWQAEQAEVFYRNLRIQVLQ